MFIIWARERLQHDIELTLSLAGCCPRPRYGAGPPALCAAVGYRCADQSSASPPSWSRTPAHHHGNDNGAHVYTWMLGTQKNECAIGVGDHLQWKYITQRFEIDTRPMSEASEICVGQMIKYLSPSVKLAENTWRYMWCGQVTIQTNGKT